MYPSSTPQKPPDSDAPDSAKAPRLLKSPRLGRARLLSNGDLLLALWEVPVFARLSLPVMWSCRTDGFVLYGSSFCSHCSPVTQCGFFSFFLSFFLYFPLKSLKRYVCIQWSPQSTYKNCLSVLQNLKQTRPSLFNSTAVKTQIISRRLERALCASCSV